MRCKALTQNLVLFVIILPVKVEQPTFHCALISTDIKDLVTQ